MLRLRRENGNKDNRNKMNKYTDEQLRAAMAQLWPDALRLSNTTFANGRKITLSDRLHLVDCFSLEEILESEYLYCCHQAEMNMTELDRQLYFTALSNICSHAPFMATWRERATALVETKGIKI